MLMDTIARAATIQAAVARVDRLRRELKEVCSDLKVLLRKVEEAA